MIIFVAEQSVAFRRGQYRLESRESKQLFFTLQMREKSEPAVCPLYLISDGRESLNIQTGAKRLYIGKQDTQKGREGELNIYYIIVMCVSN